MSSIQERRELFAKYKADVKSRGKPFFPNAMFHDTVMSLVVVTIIIVLAVVWHETANGTKAGLLGKEYDDKADPGTFSFVPRPDWYFYFLFYLLRIFKWPNTVILATVGIPTICLVLLLVVPFIDTRTERRLSRRPVAVVASIGCLNCHSYLGTGGGYSGAPDLSAEGAKGKGIQFQINHLKCPSCVNAGSPMPPFAALGDKRIHQLAVFLEASKGGK